MKSFWQINDIEIHSMHNERIALIVERFIRSLTNKTDKYMPLISKNVYIDKLDDVANKYNTYHSTIKMKHVEV